VRTLNKVFVCTEQQENSSMIQTVLPNHVKSSCYYDMIIERDCTRSPRTFRADLIFTERNLFLQFFEH